MANSEENTTKQAATIACRAKREAHPQQPEMLRSVPEIPQPNTLEPIRHNRRRRLPEVLICQLYLAGKGTVEIAEEVRTDPASVNAVLRRCGVRIRTRAEAIACIHANGRWEAAKAKLRKFNEFEICGDVTILDAAQQDGSPHSILIDTADLLRLQQYGHRWRVSIRHHTIYALARSGKETITLHRFLLGGSSRNKPIDHINHNGLDNRRCNLRAISRSGNMLNRKGVRKDNRLGVRGVKLDPRTERFIATANGKHLGCYGTIAEASAAVQARLRELGVPAHA